MKKPLIYLYRWLMWNIFSRIFVRAYLWPLYHFSTSKTSDRLPKPPFVIVSNHGTFFDPWIIGCYSWYPFAIMCNDEAFTRGAVSRWYLTSIGAFPKKKGASDFRAMKKTVSLLSAGYPVCIFPEGQTTWDGETQLMNKGIEKIVRHSKASLVLTRVTGNFLTKPWWADFIRKGRIVVTYRTLTPDQISTISDEGLFNTMKTFIAHNDIKDPENASSVFSGRRLAEGLERFVWMCMECEHEDNLATEGDTVRCAACGSSWSLTATCSLVPRNAEKKSFADLYDWSRWHRAKVIEKIKTSRDGAVLTRSEGVLMQTGDTNAAFTDAGKGAMSLSASSLTFFPETAPRSPVVFDVQKLENVVIQKKDIVEFLYTDRYYRFVFDHHSPMKWIYYLRYLKGYETCEEQGYLG
jgi:1-acyl-sn-glycerol-3-phosphate acyltransferase